MAEKHTQASAGAQIHPFCYHEHSKLTRDGNVESSDDSIGGSLDGSRGEGGCLWMRHCCGRICAAFSLGVGEARALLSQLLGLDAVGLVHPGNVLGEGRGPLETCVLEAFI